MAKRFIITFILVGLLYSGFAGANFGLVYLAGETRSYADIARTQQVVPHTLYGPVFNNSHAAYKYALLKARPHEVVVVGSSRALQYRQLFFNRTMVNCGRSMSSVRTALNFFDHMAGQPPQTILVLADFWWFREPLAEVTGGHEFTLPTGTERSLDMFFQPTWYVLEGKLDVGQIVKNSTLFGGKTRIGLRAMESDYGFEADGAFLYLPSHQTHEDMVANIRERMGSERFSYHRKLEKEAVDAFFAAVDRLRQKGHKVVVIFPPLSPAVAEAVYGNPKYAYMEKTVAYARTLGARDYSDPARLGLVTADFHDSLHTTSRGDAMVLRDLAASEPDLREVLNLQAVDAFLATGRPRP